MSSWKHGCLGCLVSFFNLALYVFSIITHAYLAVHESHRDRINHMIMTQIVHAPQDSLTQS